MGNNLTRLVKIGLFAALALTAWKGAMKTPEVASRLAPERFFNALANDGENSSIMKERHFDFNHQTGVALEIRLAELHQRGDTPPPDSLPTEARLARAIRKAEAKDMRNADYVDLAQEALARAKRMADQGWRMPVALTAVAVAAPAPIATAAPAASGTAAAPLAPAGAASAAAISPVVMSGPGPDQGGKPAGKRDGTQ